MNLTEFVNTKIKIGYSDYSYFEMGKNNPTEYEKLSGLELQYLENGCVIYKENHMNDDYEIHTYIFDDDKLNLLITNYCDTKEKQYDFYTNGKVSKSVNYLFDTKFSHTEFDKNGVKLLRVEYSQSQDNKLSGCRYDNLTKIPMSLMELEKYI